MFWLMRYTHLCKIHVVVLVCIEVGARQIFLLKKVKQIRSHVNIILCNSSRGNKILQRKAIPGLSATPPSGYLSCHPGRLWR